MQATALLGWPGAEVRRGQSSCSAKLRECQSVSQVTPAQHSNIALEIEGDIMPAFVSPKLFYRKGDTVDKARATICPAAGRPCKQTARVAAASN